MNGENGNEGVSQDGGEGVTMNFEDNPHTDGPEEVKEGTKTPEGADAVLEDRSRGAEGTHGIQDNTEGCQAPSGSGTNQDVMSETPIDGEESVVENTPQTLQTQLEHDEEATESETNRGGVPEIPVNNPQVAAGSLTKEASTKPSTTCDPVTIANNQEGEKASEKAPDYEKQEELDQSINSKYDTPPTDLVDVVADTNNAGSDTTQDIKKDGLPSGLAITKPSTTCDPVTIANNQEGEKASEKAPDYEKQEELDQSINSKYDTPPTDLVDVVADTNNAGSDTTQDIEKDGMSSGLASTKPSITCDPVTIANNQEGEKASEKAPDYEKQEELDQSINSKYDTPPADLVDVVADTNNAGSDTTQDKEKDGMSSGLASTKPSTTCDPVTTANNQEGEKASEKAPEVEKQKKGDKDTDAEGDTSPHVIHTNNAGSDTTSDKGKYHPSSSLASKEPSTPSDQLNTDSNHEDGAQASEKGLEAEKQQERDQISNADSKTSRPDSDCNIPDTKTGRLNPKQNKENNYPSSDIGTRPEDATQTPTAEDKNPESKQQEGKERPKAKEGEGRSKAAKDKENQRAKKNEDQEAKANKSDIKKEEEEPKQPIRELPVSISLCTSAYSFNVEGLESYLNRLKKERPELIKEVKIHQLPYNDIDSYRFPAEDPIDVMILCHSINNRRFAITDVMDALYDKYLPYCESVIGKAKTGVIVHDFDDMRDTVQSSRMSSFEYKQPKAFSTTSLQIICGHIEKEEQVREQMQEVDKVKLIEFLKNASNHPEEMMDRSREGDLTMIQKLWKGFKNKAPSFLFNEGYNVDPVKAAPEHHGTSGIDDVQEKTGSQTPAKRLGNETPSSTNNPKRACLPAKKDTPVGAQAAMASKGETNPEPPTYGNLVGQRMPGTSHEAHPIAVASHQSPSQLPGRNSTPSQQNSNTTPLDPRPISVSVCSSLNNVKGLMSWFTDLQTKYPSHMIEDVRFRELPYNDIDSFNFHQADPVDVMVLCHSVQNRGISITNLQSSIYDRYLKYCHDVIGKHKLAVIVHDFTDLKPETTEAKMESFRRRQPSTFELVDTVIICGSLEVSGEIEMGDTEKGQLLSFLKKARSELKENITVNKGILY